MTPIFYTIFLEIFINHFGSSSAAPQCLNYASMDFIKSPLQGDGHGEVKIKDTFSKIVFFMKKRDFWLTDKLVPT